jgi:GAF domain-containing protein/CheY-like chemotaxis protein
MRRMIPILAVIFVLFAVFGFTLYQNSVRARVERAHETALNQRVETIESLLRQVVLDATNVARRDVVISFARLAAIEGNVTTATTTKQLEVVREFLDTANDHLGSYLGLSFVNLNGSKWTQVTTSNNLLSSDSRLFQGALSDDPYFTVALSSGQAVVTPITLRKGWLGNIETIIRTLVPVIDPLSDNNLIGFIEITVNAAPLVEAIRAMPGQLNERWILADEIGQLMVDSADASALKLIGSQTVYPQLSEFVPEVAELIATYPGSELLVEDAGNAVGSVRSLYLGNLVVNTPWHIILIDSASFSAGTLLPGLLVIGLVSALACGITIHVISQTLRTRLLPLTTTRDLAHSVAAGETELLPNIDDNDEFGQITSAFQQVSSRVSNLSAQLVHQTETYQRKLRRAANLSRDLNRLTELDSLSQQAVERIGVGFGLRQTRLFLLDDIGLNAVLVSSYGESRSEASLKIQVGSDGVGQAAASGETVVQGDQLALPLKAGDSVIGVFHALASEIFTEDDVALFEMLADQLAAALQAARQLDDYQQRLRQQQAIEGQQIRHEWETTEQRLALSDAYHYDLMNTQPSETQDAEIVGLSAPITIRGEVIGSITAAAPENMPFTEGDHVLLRAIANRVGLAIEGARLFQQTSRALDETRRLYATSRAITTAQDSYQVYEEAAQRLAQGSSLVSRISIDLAGPMPGYDAPYVEVVHIWSKSPDAQSSAHIGARFFTAESPLCQALMHGKTESLYFSALPANQAAGDALRLTLTRWGAASALVMPLRSQRDWFGIVICESQQVEAFDEQYVRFVLAVADQIAIAVENRLLFEKAQSEARRALALAEAGQLATQLGSEFEQNIAQLFAQVANSANYDRWMLGLIDEEYPNRLVKITLRSPLMVDDTQEFYYDLETASHSVVDAVKLKRMLLVNDPAHYPAFESLAAGAYGDIGKHIVTPVYSYRQVVGALMVGRGLDQADLDEGDEQLVRTLAAQIAVAIDNRRLYRAAEQERENLRSIMETMPTGIVVLDSRTLEPIQSNRQAEILLGRPVNFSVPFSAADYNLIRIGTNIHYPQDELPINVVAASAEPAFSDDIAAINEGGRRTDLLISAAPIFDAHGNVSAIVAAIQDISNLRGLENTLQNSLREQISLYEATRVLAGAHDVEEALDATIGQLVVLEPIDGYIVLLDENTGDLKPARGLLSPEQFDLPQELFQSEALFVADLSDSVALDDELKQTLLSIGILALATVPMRVRDTLQGWIAVLYDRTLDFSTDNERFLTTLADNAAVALDNRALQRRTEVAFQEATILYETSRALANATTPDDLVMIAATQLRQSHLDQIFMAVPVDSTSNSEMVVVASWQRDPEKSIDLTGITLNADQFPAWSQISSRAMITIDDALTDPQLDDMARMGLASTETRALAVLPLRTGNRRLAVLWMTSTRPFVHTDLQRRIYQSFAEQASLSMEATRLLEQTERRARQLAISAEISQVASSILDLNELLPRVVDLIKDAFGYDHAQVFLMDSNDQFAVLHASTGEAGRQLLSIKHRLAKGSKSVIGQVAVTGKPVIALDTADAHVVHKPNPYLPLTRSEMALPIIVKDKIIGALDVQSNTPNAFGEEDIKVLTTLASQLAVALENARLFEEAESRAREMSFLFSATTSAATPDKSLREGLQGVAQLVRDTLGALNVSIYLTESYTDQYEQTHTLLRAVALAGSDQPISELSEIYVGNQDNILSQVANNLKAVIIPNVEEERRYLPVSIIAQSALAIPMTASNQIVGVLALEDSRAEAYTLATVNLLGTLANSLSAIVQSSRLLEQVRTQNEQLRELDRLKSDFLANMSHELRTPLNSIIGFSRVILKGIDGPLTEMQEQDLTTIYNSGTHLLGLINDILDQAKINSGKMDLHPDYFDPKPMLEGVRSIGIGLIKDKPVDIKLEIVSGLPKAYGDEFRTRQVLLNLVSNAAKFTQKGSVTIRGYVERQVNGQDMLRVDVQDTGIGIAEADIPLLFEAFRQVDSSLTRTVGGTGLGLPIAKSLIEMQGGQMLVHSVVNQGSTFSILLPLTPPAQDGDEAAAPPSEEKPDIRSTINIKRATITMPPAETGATFAPAPKPPAIGNGHNETADKAATDKRRTTQTMVVLPANRQILLIEDNPNMVDQLRRALQREAFDIFAASIPLEAEAMASGLHPTLIIMDADFAGGESWSILKRLQEREDTCDIPVIIIALDNLSERANQNGAFGFLQRPVVPEQLVELVYRAERDSQTERILIIDDQPESSRFIQQILENDGQYRIFTAHSGAEGIAMVARRRPDLVILDLRMPERDGFAVLEELRANPETVNIPVMIVTADHLNAAEKERLDSVNVIFKTDLSQHNYAGFIQSVKDHLAR